MSRAENARYGFDDGSGHLNSMRLGLGLFEGYCLRGDRLSDGDIYVMVNAGANEVKKGDPATVCSQRILVSRVLWILLGPVKDTA
jgi:hypothetical protein